MSSIDTLNERFSLGEALTFIDAGDGMALAKIVNSRAAATLCLQGAHLMRWQPHSASAPVLWLSALAVPARGKSLRGGVPVCWPWFGAHATEAGYPAHGYARTAPWEVTAADVREDGATAIRLRLPETDRSREMWPHATELRLEIVVGQTLSLALSTANLGEEAVVIGEALHTYFEVGDIESVRVLGLDGCEYLDKVEGFARRRQQGAVVFSGETDRVYVDSDAECVIEDAALRRRIHVAKSGSRSTVVWNPWAEKAEQMGDLGTDGWRRMVCVESANCHDNLVEVPPGGQHSLRAEYRVEAF